jgi:putative DNA methylase
MIPEECKRLAEVDFPIAAVSKHAVREKALRYGHPSTLHVWWARRPLAACRAMLLGLLLPDPCDEHCPEEFKAKARELLPWVQGQIGAADEDLQRALLRFIGDFANWDLSSHARYLEISRDLVRATYPEEPPLVVDPFAGSGSIPLEALRLGCEVLASDLNPVACLILKVLLEDIPRPGPDRAEELRNVSAEIKQAIEQDLAEFYPLDPDGARPIVYLWARTVRCEAPSCGAEIPLMRSLWLRKTGTRRCALKPRVVRLNGRPPQVEFEIVEPTEESDVPAGTVSQAKATCLCCGTVLSPDRVRTQLREQHGGADVIFDDNKGQRLGGVRLLAVATLKIGEQGRHYRLPRLRDYETVWSAANALQRLAEQGDARGFEVVPDELTPVDGTGSIGGGYRTTKYGIHRFGDFFSARQKLALVTLARHIANANASDACRRLLACALSIFVRSCNGNARLRPDSSVAPAFGMQTLPITWTFPETVLWGGRSEHFDGAVGTLLDVLDLCYVNVPRTGQVELADAAECPLPDATTLVWFTDPPYYDAVPYADLSDFFFVWLKRALPHHPLLRDPFDPTNPLTPKTREAVRDAQTHIDGRPKKPSEWYEQTMHRSFIEGRRVLRNDGIGSVVFAHKTTEGWEALLTGIIQGGWAITASWPIATEARSRLRARESAALATSVHLICRPRPNDAPVGDWADVLRELPRRVSDWMERLQAEGVRGADLVFACIGPALEIFSRYTKVETAEGQEVTLPEYLEKVWEVVGRTALEQVLGGDEARARNGAAGALEEDARLTALFLWTMQSTNGQGNGSQAANEVEETDNLDEDEEEEAPRSKPKGFSLVFDVVRRFAQPLGIHLPAWEDRIIETKKGVVRLMAVTERAQQLFGDAGAQAIADQLEHSTAGTAQLTLFPDSPTGAVPRVRGRGRRRSGPADVADESLSTQRGATTLDRVHAAMLLQSSGRTNALRALLAAEQERGPDFLRLANAFSALYPRGSEEKRLLDAMLLAVPR